MPGRIPMMGDPPTLEQIVEQYGDPADKLAELYFDCLAQAEKNDAAGDPEEAREARKMAERCRKDLASYGFVPGRQDGKPKAVRS